MLAGALLLAGCPAAATAHDASSWGGLFRSRDSGATWFQANQGRFVAGALAIAVAPDDANHLLLGTDTGLLVSRNGGLDWQPVAGQTGGPVFAVAFDQTGRRQLAGGDAGLFETGDASSWRPVAVPTGAVPVRAVVVAQRGGELYLVGAHGLFRSDDWSASWTPVDRGLPREPVLGLVIAEDGGLVSLVGGQVWLSDDAGQNWRSGVGDLPRGQIQTLASSGAGLWAGGADRLFHSSDGGRTWQSVGRPLPDAQTEIRGVVASPDAGHLLVSSHRGVYSSLDGGATWSSLTDNLPAHIEAGPLVRDPVEPRTVYVGFALMPYDEQWRQAVDGRSGTTSLSLADFVGAVAFLLLLGMSAGLALRWLARRSPARAAAPMQ